MGLPIQSLDLIASTKGSMSKGFEGLAMWGFDEALGSKSWQSGFDNLFMWDARL